MKAIKPPQSEAFFCIAEGYKDAANASYDLMKSDGYYGQVIYPCVFLYFRSIELSFKAFLRHQGIDSECIKNLSHRISDLILKSEFPNSLSLHGITDSDLEFLEKYSNEYSSKWFEYPHILSSNYPDADTTRSIANRLCNAVRLTTATKSSVC